LSKIAENCDHNIDPRLGELSPVGRLFYWGSLFDNCRSSPDFWATFVHGESYVRFKVDNKWVRLHFWANSSGHPVWNLHTNTQANGLSSGTDVIVLKIFSPKYFGEKIGVYFCNILIIPIVYKKHEIIFRPKLAKIAENCDHNIDPWRQSYVRCIYNYNCLQHCSRLKCFC
jgi:hypothetical protein